jgi:K+-sensing histidine kinase KdpD
MPSVPPALLESLFGMIVHDLRNPAAAIAANVGFLRDVLGQPSVSQDELQDALADSQLALAEMMRGLDQLLWMGRWFNDREALPTPVQDVRIPLEAAKQRITHGDVQLELPAPGNLVRGGEALERLLEVLICNGLQHAQGKPVCVRVVKAAPKLVIEIEDEGRPLAPELLRGAFTLEGQLSLKGRADGRYGRVAGLFAAGVLAGALGAELDAQERAGRNVFRVTLPIP